MRTFAYIIIAVSITCSSCNKEEGFGGNSSLFGYIKQVRIDRHGHPIDTLDASDQDVFIRFDESLGYEDKTTTSGDGYYTFNYLRPGDYSIYSLSECLLCSGGDEEVIQNVSLDKSSNSQVSVIYTENKVDYDDGDCSIVGKLLKQRYIGSIPVGSINASQETKVYIKYGTDSVYFDRMDTGSDGGFEFIDLIPGTYTVYAYSDCLTCLDTLTTVTQKIVVTKNDLSVSVGELIVETR